ncbi:starch-binding protein [Butyrivibrio sp. MB2005]|uniref:starch-binding protein n=1 Tax=Butyrivibrio sp. MB2005 TaxID=1280678 RepID=UPI000402D338|nr:starch-binding protein [Butyrivibrio sp. MB2005]
MRKNGKWGKRFLALGLSASLLVGAPITTGTAFAAEDETVADIETVTEESDLAEETQAEETQVEEAQAEESETEKIEEETKNQNSTDSEEVSTEPEKVLTEETEDPEEELEIDAEETITSVFEEEEETVVEQDTDADTRKAEVLAKQKERAYSNGNENDSASVSRESIHDGAILHVFCWNFDTIIEHMDEIADAGFTAIQTSPINKVIDTHPALTLTGDGQWYYHYQPTDWTIGNYQLGDREGFKALCDAADEYGIGVIVDILPNHTTPTTSQISQDMIDAVGGLDNLYHKGKNSSMNYSNRLSVTYDDMGGLPDVDTENDDFQEYFYAYLQDCINCGADGFRIDTAKHIALPDDEVSAAYADEPDRNDFYPNMVEALNEYANETGRKEYDNLFVYGEVLQGSASRLPAYQQYIGGTTASNYGSTIRSALANDNFSVSRVSDYGIADEGDYKADEDKLVTWVESHDNYINDTSYTSINDSDTVLGWAVITARKDGTPLFFSRPNNSSKNNPFGDNILGAVGNDLYKSPEVKAINNFRRDMAGKDEALSNPGNDNHLILIERMDEGAEVADGAVLVNSSSKPVAVKGDTTLADGTYMNAVEGENDIFVVKNGSLSGVIAAESVVVLNEKAENEYTTVHFYNTENLSTVKARISGQDELITGLDENDGWVRFYVPAEDFEISFGDGAEFGTYTYSISGGKESYIAPSKSDVFDSAEATEAALGIKTESVYFFNTSLWEDVKAYAWFDDGTMLAGAWPGKSTTDVGGYWIRADLKVSEDNEEPINIIFNNGTSQTQDIKIDDENIYIAMDEAQSSGAKKVTKYASKEAAEEALGISANMTTVYFYNMDNWEDIHVHMWEAYDTGEWPGIPATDEGDGWWKVVIPAGAGSDFNIIFNNNNNGKQTSNLKVTDITKRYIADNQNFASKEAALKKISGVVEYKPVYYYDDNEWDEVYAYIWGGTDQVYNDLLGGWPGTQMTKGEDGFYSVEVREEALEDGDVHLIINNGNGTQLNDKMIRNATNVYFNTEDTDGYPSAKEALGDREPGSDENGTGDEETGDSEGGNAETGGSEDGNTETGDSDTGNSEQDNAGTENSNDVTTPQETQPAVSEPEKVQESVAVTGVSFDKKTIKLGKGGKQQLSVNVAPANATNKDVTYKSSNSKIASVSASGLVKAKKKGTATITVTTKDGGFTASIKVKVTDPVKVKSVKLNKKSKTLKVKASYTLKATIKPKNATITDVTWKSSNKKVAKVDANGKVTAVGKGTAEITVTTKDGKYKATCKIKVK